MDIPNKYLIFYINLIKYAEIKALLLYIIFNIRPGPVLITNDIGEGKYKEFKIEEILKAKIGSGKGNLCWVYIK